MPTPRQDSVFSPPGDLASLRPIGIAGLIASCMLLAALSGCTTLVQVPTRPSTDKRATGMTLKEGLDYLEDAKKHGGRRHRRRCGCDLASGAC